jgi:hypothetical protein
MAPCIHAMPPPKISRPCQQRQEAISPQPTAPAPAFPNKYLPPHHPGRTRPRGSHRRVGPGNPRVHLSVTLALLVGLHLRRAGEITRPHHHHPRIAKKSFSRLSSLLPVSLSSPPPHPPLAAKSARGRRQLAVESLELERAPSRYFEATMFGIS